MLALGVSSWAWFVPVVPTVAPAPRASIVMKLGSVPAAQLAKPYDLIVVGGGPSGVAGALKGAYMGKRVLLVDKPKCAPPSGGLDPFFGGPTGLFSKALRDAAKTLDVGGLSAMGLDSDVIFKQVQNSCLRLARNNAEAQGQVLDKFKVDYLQAEATVNSIFNGRDVENEVRVTVRPHADPTQTSELVTSKLLLCTGSYPRRPPGIPFDGKQVFDSDSINAGLSFLPKSVVLVGSGIIAIEYAKIFRKLGAKVTMVVRGSAMAALDRIGLDETIAERLLTGLREEDVQVLEDTSIVSYDSLAPTGVDDYATDGVIHPMEFGLQRTSSKEDVGTIEADLYLACLGRVPRARGTSLGLEAAGVTLTEGGGHIFVDPMFETSQKNIYAAGDCIEGPALASTGVDQAQRAVSSMFGCSSDMCEAKDVPYPIGMWTIPEVGYYGLTQRQAVEAGYDADVGVATYDACLRGRVFAPDGMMKLVFDRETATILGVHIIGTDACELVHYGMDLVAKEATLFDVINTLFTAVTFHELFKEAAINGNEKLEFGIQWQEVLAQLDAAMTSGSGDFDEEVLHQKFNEIDESGDGSLDEEELARVIVSVGMSELDPTIVPNLIRLADDDGNGTIEWPEFLKIFQILHKMNSGKEKATEAVEELQAA